MVWMSEKPLDPRRSYFLKHTTQVVRAEVARVAYTVDLETLAQKPTARLELNDIGRVTLSCHRPLYCDPYRRNRATGAFILIDALSNGTVAAGMIVDSVGEGVGQGEEDHGQPASAMRPRSQVSARERWERLGQKGCVVWLAGGSAAANSELAYALERRLFDLRRMAMVVDLDERTPDAPAGAVPEPSVGEPAAEVVRSCVDLGLIVVLAGASPLRTDREALLAVVGRERVVDVDLDAGEGGTVAEVIIQLLIDRGFLPPLAN